MDNRYIYDNSKYKDFDPEKKSPIHIGVHYSDTTLVSQITKEIQEYIIEHIPKCYLNYVTICGGDIEATELDYLYKYTFHWCYDPKFNFEIEEEG